MYIIKCDKCGESTKPQANSWTEKGWQTITYTIRSAGYQKHLCPKCCKDLNIPSFTDRSRDKTVEERLIEILSQIAQDATQEYVRA